MEQEVIFNREIDVLGDGNDMINPPNFGEQLPIPNHEPLMNEGTSSPNFVYQNADDDQLIYQQKLA